MTAAEEIIENAKSAITGINIDIKWVIQILDRINRLKYNFFTVVGCLKVFVGISRKTTARG